MSDGERMTKAQLRKIYMEKRRALGERERVDVSGAIADRLFAAFDFRSLDAAHCFLPIEKFGEIDTGIIFERIWGHFPNVRTAVPRVVDSTGELEHFYVTGETRLVKNALGIDEPAGGERAEPADIDLVLVPLLCFDERGYRVGYGKGFYDRFLRECRADCVKVGLSYFPPVAEIDDIHIGDVALDVFVTPDGTLRPS